MHGLMDVKENILLHAAAPGKLWDNPANVLT
jgi:hypothetical protein